MIGMSLRKALMIKLKEPKPVYIKDDAHEMVKTCAYNIAYQDIINFIIDFENGQVNQEWLTQLAEKQKG